MPTVVVSGAVANKPLNGGSVWERLSWVRGFRRLGVSAFFAEELPAEACADAHGRPARFRESRHLAFFREAVAELDVADSAALVYDGGKDVYGASWPELLELADASDLLVNVSGHLASPTLLSRFRRKAYVDVDPGFTQLWQAAGTPGARLEGHDLYFTIGENVGRPGCDVPDLGLRWIPTRQPVVLDDWPVAAGAQPNRFTTVASWRGAYGSVELAGRPLGLKHHEWRKYAELPRLAPFRFEAALSIDPGDGRDLELLRRNGWHVVDPRAAVPDAGSFRRYVQGSAAEFSVAQGVYVETWSGWFSDRTTRYLASGKPVLVQETGFGDHLPVGEGLVSFRTLEEAVQGAHRIAADYERHSCAARRLAEEEFDSDRVLTRFLEDALP